ncbi:hypothetical protein LCGC14_1248070 [marine sediment metagenome]|uniref:Uncharacterized protein n=1 Tax=marine sediment metagenome TaxID=412755 RepID=A0A0F9L7K1_9ZZZZ
MPKEKEKEPRPSRTVSFNNILLQFAIIVFYTIVWLNAPLFGTGTLNILYFLFMFIGIVITGMLTLYSKANPDMPIPKKPTQQFSNLIKAMTDIITSYIGKKEPVVQEIRDIIQKALIWSIREAKISPEFDRKTLEDAEQYILDKLYPKESKQGK